jgi:hypothetical protein
MIVERQDDSRALHMQQTAASRLASFGRKSETAQDCRSLHSVQHAVLFAGVMMPAF